MRYSHKYSMFTTKHILREKNDAPFPFLFLFSLKASFYWPFPIFGSSNVRRSLHQKFYYVFQSLPNILKDDIDNIFFDHSIQNVNRFLMTSPSTKAHSITEAKEDLGFKSGWVILHLNNNTHIK